jgi:hypothetical protein
MEILERDKGARNSKRLLGILEFYSLKRSRLVPGLSINFETSKFLAFFKNFFCLGLGKPLFLNAQMCKSIVILDFDFIV